LGRGQAGDKAPRTTDTERAPAGSVQAFYISSKIETAIKLGSLVALTRLMWIGGGALSDFFGEILLIPLAPFPTVLFL
jgi:hypothetical protein